MSISQSISRGWAGQNGTPINPPAQVFTGSEELNFDFSVAGTTTNEQFALAFTKSLLQSIYIYSPTENLTIKTNSSSVPQDTLTITAGEPLVWDVNCGLTCPFSNNVTTAFVTNATSTATQLSIRGLTNG